MKVERELTLRGGFAQQRIVLYCVTPNRDAHREEGDD